MTKIVITSAVSIAFFLAFSFARSGWAADPLLDQMQGTWIGEGDRIQQISGAHVSLRTRTEATLRGGRLFSHNEVTELPDAGAAKTYVRDYWLEPVAGQPGIYQFGAGDRLTSRGTFDGSVLEVEQNLGGEPAYVVRSKTRFDGLESLYEETAWYGQRQLTRTLIRYHR